VFYNLTGVFYVTIGERLRNLRMENNKGQKEIADLLGLSDSGYSCYENDITIPVTKNVIKLAEYYNVTTDYILCLDKKPCLSIEDVSRRVQSLEKQITEFKNYIDNFKQP
jgi:transcriptional regulator with XRE-family HTH domain